MPYIVIFASYPPYLANKVAEKYLEVLQKYPVPSYMKRPIPAASAATKEGIEVINFDEVKEEDLGKGADYLGKSMLEFRDIKEFRWDIRIFSTISEALKNIGMG